MPFPDFAIASSGLHGPGPEYSHSLSRSRPRGLDVEPYHAALLVAELDAEEMDRDTLGAVSIRMAARLDLDRHPPFNCRL